MAQNATLISILNGVRAEARLSLNPAQNAQVRDHHVALIQREQIRLWEEFNWPHLRVERLIPARVGQRFYVPPEDVALDRVFEVWFRNGRTWIKLHPEITPQHYALHDSEAGETNWPAVAWRIYENERIEVWPVPSADGSTTGDKNGWLRLIGIRRLRPLVDDGDRADLDDQLLILYTAASLLAAQKAPDAQLKIEAANRRLATLKGNLTKHQSFTMFGAREAPRRSIVPYKPFIQYET